MLVSSTLGQTKIREGNQTMGALPVAQGGVLAGGTTGQVLKKNSNIDWDLVWGTVSSGATTFLGLTDTPSSYSGQGLKAVRVNVAADGLEFYTPTTGAVDSVFGRTGVVVATTGDYTAAQVTGAVPDTRTVNGHVLSSNVTVTASDISLGNVTNDAQTKAAILPNTAPNSGQIPIGNAGGTAYAKQTLSGSGATATLSDLGVLTLSNIANASLSNSAVANLSGTNTGDQTSVSGNAGTATALQNPRTIGGVSFDGTANIVPQTIQSINEGTDPSCFPLFISAPGSQSLQPLNNAGFFYNSSSNVLTASMFSGALSGNASTASALSTSRNLWGQSFNGSASVTGSLSSVGNITGGASSMTITSGTGNSRTLALQSTTSGGTATTFLTGNADQTVTFASGFTAAGASTIGTGNAFTAGTIELGDASDTTIARSGAGAITVEGVQVLLSGAALGTPLSGTLTNCTFPTLNQDTTGSAVYWKTSGTGKGAITGPATGTTRTYTFPDSDQTMLYSGGALGTPSSGTATNLTGTAASLNVGTAATLTTGRNINGVSFNGSAAIVAPAATTAGRFSVVSNGGAQWEEGGSVVQSGGTSTSGTPTTTVADITAAANSQIVAWSVIFNQATAANTQTKVIITYSDSSTVSDSTAAATVVLGSANAGGIIRLVTGTGVTTLTAGTALPVTRLRVETLGSGTGTRYGAISGLQVPR